MYYVYGVASLGQLNIKQLSGWSSLKTYHISTNQMFTIKFEHAKSRKAAFDGGGLNMREAYPMNFISR